MTFELRPGEEAIWGKSIPGKDPESELPRGANGRAQWLERPELGGEVVDPLKYASKKKKNE